MEPYTRSNYHILSSRQSCGAVKFSFLSKTSETKPLATVLFLHNRRSFILGLKHASCLVGRVHGSFLGFVCACVCVCGSDFPLHLPCFSIGTQGPYTNTIFLMNGSNPVERWKIPQDLYPFSCVVITAVCVLWMRSPTEENIKGSLMSVVFCRRPRLWLCAHRFHNNHLSGTLPSDVSV